MDKGAFIFSARWNEGSQCFAIFFVVLIGCGLAIQFFRFSEMRDFKHVSQSKNSLIPLFTFMSIIVFLAGIVLFGRPYRTLIVGLICLVILRLIFSMALGLVYEKNTVAYDAKRSVYGHGDIRS